MDTDYYSDSGESSDTPSPSGSAEESTPDDNKPETQTALIPKSLFGGDKPTVGDICKFKVEHEYEDEYEISWVKDDSSSKPEMDNAMAGMDELASNESED